MGSTHGQGWNKVEEAVRLADEGHETTCSVDNRFTSCVWHAAGVLADSAAFRRRLVSYAHPRFLVHGAEACALTPHSEPSVSSMAALLGNPGQANTVLPTQASTRYCIVAHSAWLDRVPMGPGVGLGWL